MSVREPDFAGSWYPDKRSKVLSTIKEFEEGARTPKVLTGDLVGGIVPHAGWFFSGKLACNVVKVVSERSKADTIVVFGSHMAPRHKPKILVEGDWWTPLGNIPTDVELVRGLLDRFSFDEESPTNHYDDNTIELQMPFIKHYYPDVRVVAIGAPPMDISFEIGSEVVRLAKALGRRLVVIGSTDMTHYGPNYGLMPEGVGEKAVRWVKEVNDRKAIDLMVAMEPQGLVDEAEDNHNACCMGAAAAALHVGKLLGAKKAELLDYYTSYDISPGTSFVGYAGVVF